MERALPPTSSKQLKRFLGMINFYEDVFKRRRHILAPLNDLAAAIVKQKKGDKRRSPSFERSKSISMLSRKPKK